MLCVGVLLYSVSRRLCRGSVMWVERREAMQSASCCIHMCVMMCEMVDVYVFCVYTHFLRDRSLGGWWDGSGRGGSKQSYHIGPHTAFDLEKVTRLKSNSPRPQKQCLSSPGPPPGLAPW